jgi:hypothetical protein
VHPDRKRSRRESGPQYGGGKRKRKGGRRTIVGSISNTYKVILKKTYRLVVDRPLVPILRVPYNTIISYQFTYFQREQRPTHKSSLIVLGFPNCVAVDRSKVKQINHTRVRFKISRSCRSFWGFVVVTWCKLRSVAILSNTKVSSRYRSGIHSTSTHRMAKPVYSQLRSSSHLFAGCA